jgi:hypothetical protein
MKVGAGVAGMAMLAQQLRNYEALFQELATQMGDFIGTIQREANREFTPVIARNLSAAYEWCAAERGKTSPFTTFSLYLTFFRGWTVLANEEVYV